MKERVIGYWALTWVGLISNILALPIIALILSYGPPLKVANITLAISLGWPSAIVGIVSSSALLAEKKMGRNTHFSSSFDGNFWNGTIYYCETNST